MTNSRTKTTAIAIALFLVLTIAAASVALPIVNAHTPAWTVPNWSFIALVNTVIGVNQEVVIVYWNNAVPPTANGAYGDRWTFTIDITAPDGSEETLGPFTSDPVGGGWATYTPTQVGTYTLVAKMAEHKITGLPLIPGWGPSSFGYVSVDDIYTASTSDPVELIVQEQQVQPWSETPLPTQYWTRPINSLSRSWNVLASNWLAASAQVNGPTSPFSWGTGPESAHIMWATPMWSGGIMDARFGDTGFQTAHYEGLGLTPPIIIDGRIFYNVQSLPREGWYCLDLYTGETLYFHNTTGPVQGVGGGFSSSGSISGEQLSFGQIYDYASPNQHGGMPYLWSTPAVAFFAPPDPNAKWMMFDAYSGNYICSIKNVPSWAYQGGFFGPSVTSVYGKDGSLLGYNIANYGTPAAPNYYLQCWNTSRAIWYKSFFASNDYWMWRPGLNYTYDGNNGYSLNASIPAVQGSIYTIREDKYVIGGTSGKNNGTTIIQGNLWALNLKADSNGVITPSLLWNITYTPPQTTYNDYSSFGMFTSGAMSGPAVDPEDGVFLFSEPLSRRHWGYSLETGKLLWGPTEPEAQMNFYGLSRTIYQGKLFSCGYSGLLVAYDIKTGAVLWNYTAAQEGYESPYGNYPIGVACVADGKLYLTSSEHSPTQPLWRGSYLRCINASNGVELWKINNWGMGMGSGSGVAMADGLIVSLNAYDNQIYCYGKGPSATTVTAPDTALPLGSSVVIRGTVTDQTPAAKGTPAIADASMQHWMEYLYMDQGIPTNASGVEVTLDTIDPNSNFVHIATVHSDMSGLFSYMWEPEVPGTYTVIATFGGSASYYGSYAETAVGIIEAPAVTAPPEYPQPIDNTLTIVGVGIAMIIAVAIAAVLILRKK